MSNSANVTIDKLPYNQVSMKASHNSEEREETIIEQITWNKEENYNGGCSSIELDVSQSSTSTENKWSVNHDEGYKEGEDKKLSRTLESSNSFQLSDFFFELQKWSKNNPNHDVITLYLDLKYVRNIDEFAPELDEYIKMNFDVDIYTPSDLMGKHKNLSEGAKNNGWPSIEALQGKFIICLTGNAEDKKANAKEKYAKTEPSKRLCFADKDIELNKQDVSDDHRVFFNCHIFNSSRKKWMEIFKEFSKNPEVIFRAWEADSQENWNDCLESGCNIIATNKVKDNEWAKVGNQRFSQLGIKPG